MRLLCALLALSLQIGPPDPPGPVAGIVRGDDGRPIPGATVTMSGIEGGRVDVREVVTSADGRFVFEELLPTVAYTLRAEAGAGYLPAFYHLPEDARSDFEVALMPAATIRGRVTDAGGTPLAGVAVRAIRPLYDDGLGVFEEHRHFDWTLMALGVTDLDGEYALTPLAPGRYYVLLDLPPASTLSRMGLDRGGRFAGMRYAETFFGAIGDVPAAGVDVRAGMVREGVDIRIEEYRGRSVGGELRDQVTGETIRSGDVFLIPANAGVYSPDTRHLTARDGKFEADDVLPGAYLLLARSGEASAVLAGRIRFEVGEGDVDGLEVGMAPPLELRGRLRVEGGELDPEAFGSIAVELVPARPASERGEIIGIAEMGPSRPGLPTPQFALGGRLIVVPPIVALGGPDFVLSGVMPWRYQVRLSTVGVASANGATDRPLDSAYVAGLYQAGEELLTSGGYVDPERGSDLEIAIRLDAGRVQGRVVHEGAAVGVTRVTLVPDGARRERRDLYRSTLAGSSGRFEFDRVPPGNYRVFAWESTEEEAWGDPGYFEMFASYGAALGVGGHQRVEVEVEPVPRYAVGGLMP